MSETYADYLQSDHWQQFRKRKLRQVGHRCQVCNNEDLPLHLHHRTYENKGDEDLQDVTVLCQDCHALFHDRILRSAPDACSYCDAPVYKDVWDYSTSVRLRVRHYYCGRTVLLATGGEVPGPGRRECGRMGWETEPDPFAFE